MSGLASSSWNWVRHNPWTPRSAALLAAFVIAGAIAVVAVVMLSQSSSDQPEPSAVGVQQARQPAQTRPPVGEQPYSDLSMPDQLPPFVATYEQDGIVVEVDFTSPTNFSWAILTGVGGSPVYSRSVRDEGGTCTVTQAERGSQDNYPCDGPVAGPSINGFYNPLISLERVGMTAQSFPEAVERAGWKVKEVNEAAGTVTLRATGVFFDTVLGISEDGRAADPELDAALAPSRYYEATWDLGTGILLSLFVFSEEGGELVSSTRLVGEFRLK